MNQIETNDLFKCAYLLAKSYRLAETKYVDGHQVRFIIEGDNLKDEEQRYRTGNAQVNPLQLKECLDFLREELNQTLRKNRTGRTHATYSTSRS